MFLLIIITAISSGSTPVKSVYGSDVAREFRRRLTLPNERSSIVSTVNVGGIDYSATINIIDECISEAKIPIGVATFDIENKTPNAAGNTSRFVMHFATKEREVSPFAFGYQTEGLLSQGTKLQGLVSKTASVRSMLGDNASLVRDKTDDSNAIWAAIIAMEKMVRRQI